MKNSYGIIYKSLNKANGKVYIGKTTNELERRSYIHFLNAENNMQNIFYRAIRKYGKENFIFEQIDSANSIEELNNKEVYWIDYYRSYIGFNDCNGYNMTLGGDGGDTFSGRTDEQKQKYRKWLSEKYSGEGNPMFGSKGAFFGVERPDHSNKMRELWQDENFKLKILNRKYAKGKRGKEHKKSRPIGMYDKNMGFVRSFDSLRFALDFLNVKGHSSLINSIRKNKLYKGHYWRYLDENI